jgi:hypothetical protein
MNQTTENSARILLPRWFSVFPLSIFARLRKARCSSCSLDQSAPQGPIWRCHDDFCHIRLPNCHIRGNSAPRQSQQVIARITDPFSQVRSVAVSGPPIRSPSPQTIRIDTFVTNEVPRGGALQCGPRFPFLYPPMAFMALNLILEKFRGPIRSG